MAKIIKLILAYELKGEGTKKSPVRRVAQLYTEDGCLVAEETTKWDKGFFHANKLTQQP